MKSIYLSLILFLSVTVCFGQEEENYPIPLMPNHGNPIFEKVDVEAEYPGGLNSLQEFVTSRFELPQLARYSHHKSGRVMLKFIVERDGSVSQITAIGEYFGYGLEEEAIRILKMTKKWKPAKINDVQVRSYYYFPVYFVIPQEGPRPRNTPLNPPKPKIDDNGVYEKVEVEAEYPGGTNSLRKFIYRNIKYPKRAIENRTQGMVALKFIIEIDGSISNVTILKDIGDGCGEEGKRVIKLTSGKWKPALIDDKSVRSYYRFPVTFRLP